MYVKIMKLICQKSIQFGIVAIGQVEFWPIGLLLETLGAYTTRKRRPWKKSIYCCLAGYPTLFGAFNILSYVTFLARLYGRYSLYHFSDEKNSTSQMQDMISAQSLAVI